MARPKLPRKSTNIDMTAMCDVAFLLLSFFILATEFKPTEPVFVATPNSVSAETAPEKDIVMISITPQGQVFIRMDEVEVKEKVLSTINQRKNLGLSEGELTQLKNKDFYGSSFAGLKGTLQLPSDKYNGTGLPGIPVTDSSNNEMKDWMNAVATAYAGKKMNLLLKGDMNSKYPAFKNVIDAFKANDLLKFKMVTNPENVPAGTELFSTGKRKK